MINSQEQLIVKNSEKLLSCGVVAGTLSVREGDVRLILPKSEVDLAYTMFYWLCTKANELYNPHRRPESAEDFMYWQNQDRGASLGIKSHENRPAEANLAVGLGIPNLRLAGRDINWSEDVGMYVVRRNAFEDDPRTSEYPNQVLASVLSEVDLSAEAIRFQEFTNP